MSEEKAILARFRAVRGGNRAVITKLINETRTIFEDEQPNRGRLKIINSCEVSDIANEIEEADELNSRILDVQREIKELLNDVATKSWQKNTIEDSSDIGNEVLSVPEQSSEQSTIQEVQIEASGSTSLSTTNDAPQPAPTEEGAINPNPINNVSIDHSVTPLRQYQSKLPKFVLPKFKGDITQWRTFWDSFNSAVHTNQFLTNIDKFNHLNSLLEGQAKRSIQGLALSEQNYQAAIDILQQRFGNQQLVISTHMDELLKIPACAGDKASQLRFVYDRISVNVRGLEALGVKASQYGSLLIPVLMSKLPQDIRLQIARKTSKEVWDISEILDVIRNEVEAREMSEGVKVIQNEKPRYQSRPPSASALLVNNGSHKGKIRCVYCNGDHFSASCEKVRDRHARTEILRKDRRCYVCLMFGHISAQCDPKRSCRKCQGKHQSICLQSCQPPSQHPGSQPHGSQPPWQPSKCRF